MSAHIWDDARHTCSCPFLDALRLFFYYILFSNKLNWDRCIRWFGKFTLYGMQEIVPPTKCYIVVYEVIFFFIFEKCVRVMPSHINMLKKLSIIMSMLLLLFLHTYTNVMTGWLEYYLAMQLLYFDFVPVCLVLPSQGRMAILMSNNSLYHSHER